MANYYLVIEGRNKGPYTAERIQGMWAQGHIARGTPCLKEGESQPRPIEQISDLTKPPPKAKAKADSVVASAEGIQAMVQAHWKYILPAGAGLLVICLLVIFLIGGKDGPTKEVTNLPDSNTTSPPGKKPDPGIDGTAPDGNRTFTPGTGLGSNFQAGPAPPPMVQGRDFEYSLGKLEIRTYGTELPEDEKNYLLKKADELIVQFENFTGVKPPKGFYYQVYYYKDPRQFQKVTGKDPSRWGGFTYWNHISRDKIAPIHCHGGFHTLLHEMVHAITWPAYGPMPLFMTEGFAEWLAFMFLYNPDHRTRSDLFRQVKALASRIRSKNLPTLDQYLKSQNYGHWQRMFGQIGVGYGAGNLLVDFLLVNEPDWTKKALTNIGKGVSDQNRRSMAFHKYVEDHWPGGLAGLDKGWHDWILKKEKDLSSRP